MIGAGQNKELKMEWVLAIIFAYAVCFWIDFGPHNEKNRREEKRHRPRAGVTGATGGDTRVTAE